MTRNIRQSRNSLVQLLIGITKSLRHLWKTLCLIVVVVIATIIVHTTISVWLGRIDNLHFPTFGNIEVIGVRAFWDEGLQNETKQIEWGTVNLGLSYNVSLYLKSESTVITTLKLKALNWTFMNLNNEIASGPTNDTQYMNLTWDYDNRTLSPSEIVPVTMILSISSSPVFVQFLTDNEVKYFKFDITIRAYEQ